MACDDIDTKEDNLKGGGGITIIELTTSVTND
jgi:hypothetical protein